MSDKKRLCFCGSNCRHGILPDSADDENGLPSPNLVYGEKAYKVFEAKTSDEEEVISLCAGLVCIVSVSSRSRSIGKLILHCLELSHLRRLRSRWQN